MRVPRSYWLGLGSGLILSAMLTLLASSQQGQALLLQKLSFSPIKQQVTTQTKTEAVTSEKELTPTSEKELTATSVPPPPTTPASELEPTSTPTAALVPTPPSVSESNSQAVSNSKDAVTVTPEGLTARFVFKQTCWMEVKVDGRPSIKGTFSAGTSKEVKGTKKIELVSVGNAGGFTITLNGKTLPSLGKSGKVLHNVMLTTDTLKSLK